MKKITPAVLLFFLTISVPMLSQSGFYKFRVKTLDGGEFDFNSLKGKKVMIVNTASKCGFTPQYRELEALYRKYGDQLIIIGFPANNFMRQEPGSNEEIKKILYRKLWCQLSDDGKNFRQGR